MDAHHTTQGRLVPRIGRARHRLYLLVLDAAAHLPLRLAYGVARWAGRVRHRLLLRSLRVNPDAVRALEARPHRVRALARRAAELRASQELERRLLPRLDGPVHGSLVRIDGMRHLETALEGGRGAVLFSVHVWSADTLFAALGELGYPPNVVGRGPDTGSPVDRARRLSQVADLERRFGARYLWMGEDPFVAVRAASVLRANGVVAMFPDRPAPGASVEVSLLGGRTRLAAGPALLAQSAGAPLLDFYLYRTDRWAPLVAEIGPPFAVEGPVERAVEICADRLDAHLRRDPAPWTFFSSRDSSDLVDASAPG